MPATATKKKPAAKKPAAKKKPVAKAAGSYRTPLAKPGRGQLLAYRRDVLDAIKRVKPAVPKSSSMDAWKGVLIHVLNGKVTFTVTDFDLTVHRPLPDAKVSGATFQALVSCADLDVAVKRLPGDVLTFTITRTKGRAELVVAGGSRTVTLAGLRVEDLPVVATAKVGAAKAIADFDRDAIDGALLPALQSVSKDEARPILTGVYLDLENRTVVSTDSYRLGVFPAKMRARATTDRPGINIPGRAVALACRDTQQVQVSESVGLVEGYESTGPLIRLDTDDATILARRITGQYPNHTQLMPDPGDTQVTADVDAKQLLEDVTFTGHYCTHNAPLRVVFGKSDVTITGVGLDRAEASATIPAKITDNRARKGKNALGWFDATSKDGAIGLNPDYLASAIRALVPLRGGGIRLDGITRLRPVLVTGRNGSVLLMPIRLNV